MAYVMVMKVRLSRLADRMRLTSMSSCRGLWWNRLSDSITPLSSAM